MSRRKKLIEVALPLEAINLESAREKSIRHGHPSTLHLWWARRPLAACRAVLWASLVDDPSSWPDKFPTEADQERERQRLFNILGRIEIEQGKRVVRGLVSWDDVNNPNSGVLEAAQREIARCLAWDRGEEPPTDPAAVREYIAKYAPPVYDPFAGGGSIPLEAQRLGLEAHASDLNPVAVLINKALIEIPPKFKDKAPINPEDRAKKHISAWRGAQGLAADVRYYGAWMRKQAFERIGHLYPPYSSPVRVSGTESLGTEELTVIAWLWARTVTCPNPACRCQMPLVRSFQLSTKKGKEVWVEPVVVNGGESASAPSIRFVVKSGKGQAPEGTVGRRGARCIACGTPVPLEYIRKEGQAGRMGAQLMAIVAEGQNGRVYLSPQQEHVEIAESAQPTWKPEADLPQNPRNFNTPIYGLNTYDKLFTPRQLVALTTFSDLVAEAREKAIADAKVLRTADATAAGLPNDDVPLAEGGTGARAYGEAISVYLSFAINKSSDYWSSICTWHTSGEKMSHVFTRQAIPMAWDFAEANPMSDSTGNFNGAIDWIVKVLENALPNSLAQVTQHDATAPHPQDTTPKLISTDPPYYDNISYADLSDFFYVWLRRCLNSVYPDLFSTLLAPKDQELVATPYRFSGDKQKTKEFFEAGLSKAFNRIRGISHADYPLTVYYAFKQTEEDTSPQGQGEDEEDDDTDKPIPLSRTGRGARGESPERMSGRVSTGWETMLEGLIRAGFTIDGTWPLRTELANRMIASGTNALASSIVLVCRPRPADAPKATRRQFLAELKRELPEALKLLQQGSIAPVDLAQASIGPGMAIYSRYAAVLESDGSPLTVRTALQLINQYLDEYLSEQEGELDEGSRWATTWFAQYQFEPGPYGEAEVLSKARNVSIESLEELGILEAKAGKVRLLRREEIAQRKEKGADSLSLLLASSAWLITQTLIHTLDQKGEMGAAALLAALGDRGAVARDLAYRLYTLCDKKGWAQEALVYNTLVIAWPEINRLASEMKKKQHDPFQPSLL
ncbi:DUF1156 domain-containing protein [Thermostichus sp. MS-CIW-28]